MSTLREIRPMQKLVAERDCSRCALTFKKSAKRTTSYLQSVLFSPQFPERDTVRPIVVGDKQIKIHLNGCSNVV
jgi:hypothetical protein